MDGKARDYLDYEDSLIDAITDAIKRRPRKMRLPCIPLTRQLTRLRVRGKNPWYNM